jgi:hypothetical protein
MENMFPIRELGYWDFVDFFTILRIYIDKTI